MHINVSKCHNFTTKGLPSFLCLQITQFHHRKFVQLFLWSLKPRTNPPSCIRNVPILKKAYHYAFKSSWNHDKLPLHAFVNFQNQIRPPLCAFVNSQNENRPHCAFAQDQNEPNMQIHDLLKSKQTTSFELPRRRKTSIMHLWAPKVKWKPHYAYMWTLTIKSNVHYIYLWAPKTKSPSHYMYNL
jgi:hypothetical protein